MKQYKDAHQWVTNKELKENDEVRIRIREIQAKNKPPLI